MSGRIVERTDGSERFVETGPKAWAQRLEAWRSDHSLPCPMPPGHRMFGWPEEYDCRRVEASVAALPGISAVRERRRHHA